MSNPLESDFRRYPYRGILAEIAREDGTTRQAVQKAARRGSPDILQRIAAKMQERRRLVRRVRRLLRA